MTGLISRVADHCFWLGRYLERSENTARILQATRGLVLDTEMTPEECWRPLLVAAGGEPAFVSRFGLAATADAEVTEQYMVWDDENYSSLVSSIHFARENAQSVREVMSLDAWEVVNELYLWIASPSARAQYATHRYGFHRHVRDSIQLCLGLLRSTMLHDTPLDFIWLGVRLERADQTARLIDVRHPVAGASPRHPVVETAIWTALLRAASALEPFLQRHRGRVTPESAAAFLILETSMPRSVRYCVQGANNTFRRIRPTDRPELPGAESAAALAMMDAWMAQLSQSSLDPAHTHVHLTRAINEIAGICNTIRHELFGIDAPPLPPPADQAAA